MSLAASALDGVLDNLIGLPVAIKLEFQSMLCSRPIQGGFRYPWYCNTDTGATYGTWCWYMVPGTLEPGTAGSEIVTWYCAIVYKYYI